MFIRKTKSSSRLSKKPYFVFQLTESVRTAKGPRQRLLLSLGSEIPLPEEEHGALAERIASIVSGELLLFNPAEKIEQLAQLYAKRLVSKLSKKTTKPQPQAAFSQHAEEAQEDYQTVDINSIAQGDARTVGPEHLMVHVTDQLQLAQQLRSLGLSDGEVALSLGSIIGRAVHPASERATHTWLAKHSGLGELLGVDFEKTSLDGLYKISDTLLEHKEALERYLSIQQQKVHGHKSVMALYDLTNTYMEGRSKNNAKAKFGVSKEKRSDCPLVTLGLVVDEHGFATRSKILPGNISEPSTLAQAIEALDEEGNFFKPTVIMDAGIATEENLALLRERHYTYVVCARQDPPSTEREDDLVQVETANGTEVKVALIKSDSTEERWLYCQSEAKAAVSSQMKNAFQERFEADLQRLSDALAKPRGRKRYDKVLERVGRLQEKHRRVSGCYNIVVTPSQDHQRAISITWELSAEKLAKGFNGHYYLRTNITDKRADELWYIYNTLRKIEDSFRFMKSSLGMRPVYHQKERRVDGHLWITLLAYHLIQSCLYRLRANGINNKWEAIRNTMSNRVRVTVKMRKQDGEMLYRRTTTTPEDEHNLIYTAMNMSSRISQPKTFTM